MSFYGRLHGFSVLAKVKVHLGQTFEASRGLRKKKYEQSFGVQHCSLRIRETNAVCAQSAIFSTKTYLILFKKGTKLKLTISY